MSRVCLWALLAVAQVEATDPTNPTARALERWKSAHVQSLKRQGRVEYQVVGLSFYAGDADPPDQGTGPANSAVVTERTTSGGTCTIGMRELTLSWKKGEDQAFVEKEAVLGEDCCDLDHCATRTAGGWMAHLVRVCAESEGREQRLRELIDPKRGIRVQISTRERGERKNRWKRADADSLCNLEIAKFSCEDNTPGVARFTCSTASPLEHYYFVWRRTNGAVYVEKIGGILED
jgi:hypothetical protein